MTKKSLSILVTLLVTVFTAGAVLAENAGQYSTHKFKNHKELQKTCIAAGTKGYLLTGVAWSDTHKEGMAVFVKTKQKKIQYRLMAFKNPKEVVKLLNEGTKRGYLAAGMAWSDDHREGLVVFAKKG